MPQDVTYYGVWTQVPYVDLPHSNGGSAIFTDVSDTTATPSDVSNTKYFYNSIGKRIQGTNAGGSSANLQSKTVSPSVGQVIVTPDSNYDGLSQVTVEAIPNDFVGSNVPRKTSTDLVVSGATVTAPAGYYETAANKSVTTAEQAIPTISVNSNNGLITSTVTQSTGYVNGSTKSATLQLSTQAAKTITPSTAIQTAVTSGKYTTGVVKVSPIPSEYIVPTGTITISSNSIGVDVTQYAAADVSVAAPTPNLENKTITPSESKQTISASSSYDGLGTVTVNAITATYVGTGVARKTSSDMTMSGATVTAPAGYYAAASSKTITAATQATPTISINSSGLITSTVTQSAGYVSAGTTSATKQLTVQAGKTVTPSTSAQTAVASGRYTTGTITVAAIPSEYIVPTGTVTISANGTGIDVAQYASANVAVPATVPNLSSKTVTPSESKQTITPGTGYDGLSTVIVNAITASYVGTGVTQRTSSDMTMSGATVTAPAGYYASAASKTITSMTLPTTVATTFSGTTKATVSRSTSDQYINIPTGYNGTAANYKISAVANGSATPTATLGGTSAELTTGTNTLTLTKTISNTPVVNAGYVSAGTAGNTKVTLTASVTTKGTATITPGTTDQTITSGTYLTGVQTIKGDSNLVASNIISTATIFGVTGSVVIQNYYTGSTAPTAGLGVNGDIYLQTG